MNTKKIFYVFGVAIILSFHFSIFSCSSNNQANTISVDEFEKQLIATKGEQLVDVRTAQEFEKYRIVSAKNIDVKASEFSKEIEKLDKNRPVLIYCLSGARSKSAMEILQRAGFKTIYNLDGGINAWLKAEKPVDQDLSGIGEISSADYKDMISVEGYVLVDYYAPWCGPCREMLPIVNELAETYPDKFKLLTIDFDQNRLLAKEQSIKSVPYLAVFKDGEKIWDKNGETSKEELIKILKLAE